MARRVLRVRLTIIGKEPTMRVQDIMTAGVQTIEPAQSAEAAWEIMKQKGIRHLLVLDRSERVGILSSRDLGGSRGTTVRNGRTVGELMTPGVVSVLPTTTVRQAANLMRGRSIGSLIVGSPRRAVGIVTVSDLLDLVGSRGDTLAVQPRPRRVLSHRVPHRKRHRAAGPW
jgi:acetoin utilization protein AcuB